MEALAALFANLPAIPRISCLVGHWLPPNDRRLLGELIGRETRMTVKEVEPGEVVADNTVYVTPANHGVVLRDGRLDRRAPSTAECGAALVVAIAARPPIADPARAVSAGDGPAVY